MVQRERGERVARQRHPVQPRWFKVNISILEERGEEIQWEGASFRPSELCF